MGVGATPIDAIPDLSDNQVIVFTDWPGHSPQEMEDQVTYPLTVNLQGLAGVRVVRSQSAFGFSMIYVIFEDNVDLYFARARVLERMSLITKTLPAGVTPTLGPDATGVGHVFWYTVESPTLSLRDLRTLQDWFVRYQLNAVPGVAEVASVGGYVQQYQIDVDPNRLRTYNLPLSTVVAAVRDSNLNVGGNVLESNGAWLIVRGVGLIASVDDVKRIVVGAFERRADLRRADRGRSRRRLRFAWRHSSRARRKPSAGSSWLGPASTRKPVIDAVKARIAQIQPGLPAGVTIVPFYDRSTLIEQSVDTLRHALLEEIALVTLAHVIFLMHFRSILIVTIPLPLAVLLSFLGMYYAGISSNIMSLAGIAIAIGVLVDAGIVVTENAFRYVEQQRRRSPRSSARLADRARIHTPGRTARLFLDGDHSPGIRPGLRADRPGRKTLSPTRVHQDVRGPRGHGHLRDAGTGAVFAPARREIPLGGCEPGHAGAAAPVPAGPRNSPRTSCPDDFGRRACCSSGALVVARGIGSEFMPPLNEGDLMFMPIADPSISLEENTKIAAKQNATLMSFPEVDYVVAKVARADTSTDPAPLNMTETIVHLKPRERVACRHDAGSIAGGYGTRRANAGRLEHLDDADHQPNRHADDGRSV